MQGLRPRTPAPSCGTSASIPAVGSPPEATGPVSWTVLLMGQLLCAHGAPHHRRFRSRVSNPCSTSRHGLKNPCYGEVRNRARIEAPTRTVRVPSGGEPSAGMLAEVPQDAAGVRGRSPCVWNSQAKAVIEETARVDYRVLATSWRADYCRNSHGSLGITRKLQPTPTTP